MFQTVTDAEIKAPFDFLCSHVKLWNAVGLNIVIPWFYVTYNVELE
jgi:hypothetical protein